MSKIQYTTTLPPLSQLMPNSYVPYSSQQVQQHQHQPLPQQYHQQHIPSPPYIKSETPLSLSHLAHQRTMSNSLSPVERKPVINTQTKQTSTSPKYLSKQPLDKCTCKHDGNHVPRPRNAFILFRQQHHQSVLDEGDVVKTNPDVSRELGKRWRDLEPHEKDYWNKLAEEEKKKHAEKYPGYRYIPRRFGKKGSCPFCKAKALAKQQQQQQQQSQHQFHLQQQQAQAQLQRHQEVHQPDSYSNASSEEHAIAQNILSLRNQNYYYPHQPQQQQIHERAAPQYFPYGTSYPQMASHQPAPPQMLHHHHTSSPQISQQHQQQYPSAASAHQLPQQASSSQQQFYSNRQLPLKDVPRYHTAPHTSNIRQESDLKSKSCSISQLID